MLEPELDANLHGGPHSIRRGFTRDAIAQAKHKAIQLDESRHSGLYPQKDRVDLKAAAKLWGRSYMTAWALVKDADKPIKTIVDPKVWNHMRDAAAKARAAILPAADKPIRTLVNPEPRPLACGGVEWTVLKSGFLALKRATKEEIKSGKLGPNWKTTAEIAEGLGFETKDSTKLRALGWLLAYWRTEETSRWVKRVRTQVTYGGEEATLVRKVLMHYYPAFESWLGGHDIQELYNVLRRKSRAQAQNGGGPKTKNMSARSNRSVTRSGNVSTLKAGRPPGKRWQIRSESSIPITKPFALGALVSMPGGTRNGSDEQKNPPETMWPLR